MVANDDGQFPAEASNFAREPTPPLVDPEDRPSIEPTDALPTDKSNEEGFLDRAKSFLSDNYTDASAVPAPTANAAAQPTPPPVPPADRPKIEPTDALPTDEQQRQ